MDVPSHPMVIARTVRVYGLVQGVGFRPFLHRIASREGVAGRVRNRNDCVEIELEASARAIDAFITAVEEEAPPLARITRIETDRRDPSGIRDFRIISSADGSNEITRVSPDTAVCDDCLTDMQSHGRRVAYPFTNCTNCGPRFSIVRALPYDRPNTTMAPFAMCPACRGEYEDITDRRYHAQPNACRECGPAYTLEDVPPASADGDRGANPPGAQPDGMLEAGGAPQRADHGTPQPSDHGDPQRAGDGHAQAPNGSHDPITAAAALIDSGGIVAVKGIGGFHLSCDARCEAAVQRLRQEKRREAKPFAVMCRNIEEAARIARLDEASRALLESPRTPIVLLDRRGGAEVAPSVAAGLDTLGIMLPYAPVHHVLFERLATPVIVMTSGNLSDEPITISNDDARTRLAALSDALLLHDRVIHNRLDDSVATVVGGAPRLLRRARGWVPEPVAFDAPVEGIAAFGAELKHTFCIGKGREAIPSQHIGDLKGPESLAFFEESFERFSALFRFTPSLAACDLHPAYLSTRFARNLGVPVVPVQHHHAHIAAVTAEHGITERVIGVALDGTGYGEDGASWGGEILIASRSDYSRFAHLRYMPLPGGDRAVDEPWRLALALLIESFETKTAGLFERLVSKVTAAEDQSEVRLLESMVRSRVHTPLSSGAGRLFDGVAALAGIAGNAAYEAEGPMRLEAALPSDWYTASPYPFDIVQEEATAPLEICPRPTIRRIARDVDSGAPTGEISSRFHRGLADVVLRVVDRARDETGISSVAFGGGVFQNRKLSAFLEAAAAERGFQVLVPHSMPPNDGGVCLGQLAVAAARSER